MLVKMDKNYHTTLCHENVVKVKNLLHLHTIKKK